jgi:hypothetical protein
MPKKLRPAVDLMAFKCRTLKVKINLTDVQRECIGLIAPAKDMKLYWSLFIYLFHQSLTYQLMHNRDALKEY